jgi:hypothetical protein
MRDRLVIGMLLLLIFVCYKAHDTVGMVIGIIILVLVSIIYITAYFKG